MIIQDLITQIRAKKSYLCVGLDSDVERLPVHLPKRPESILEFNRNIIEATKPYTVAYKINTAFYEQYGAQGWEIMSETLKMVPKDCFTIADAKRGDIGNTGKMYAKAFMDFDSITVSPYMGRDSVEPFLESSKVVIVLGLTSNPGSQDFQVPDLYKKVISKASKWGTKENMMFVVGATQAEKFKEIREIVPEHFLLVPGVGSQGGSLEDVSRYGLTKDIGLLINSSRGVIYASQGKDYAQRAGEEASMLQISMSHYFD